MDRLFFEKSKNKAAAGSNSNQDTKEYLEKISKLVPSEIIIAFITIVGLVQLVGNKELVPWLFYGATLLCTALTPMYLIRQTPPDAPYRPTVHYIISTIAFLVWAYATAGDKAPGLYYEAPLASIILIAFSLISGLIPQR